MNKDINFPIKYAILELKEEGGYLTNYEDVIRGYIVSKCWVVQSSIKYFSNGNYKIYHKVIFPYKDLSTLKMSLHNNSEYIGERTVINYNPYPTDVVLELFDTYEDAKKMAEEKNEKMKHKIVSKIIFDISNSNFKQILSKYEQEFEEQLSICQLFEKLSLLNTKDMNITNCQNTNKLELLKVKNFK